MKYPGHIEQARAAILRWHRNLRTTRKPCGAKRKHDGKPCQQIAMANGRCCYHGGRTPKGDAWHKPRWPNRDAADAEKKLVGKLRDMEKAQRARDKRLANMTPAQRTRYDRWLAAHRAVSAAGRAEARERRKQASEARALIERQSPAVSAEVERIQTVIDELERRATPRFDVFD
jgi:flagellar biosynthesis GTPase FlhF